MNVPHQALKTFQLTPFYISYPSPLNLSHSIKKTIILYLSLKKGSTSARRVVLQATSRPRARYPHRTLFIGATRRRAINAIRARARSRPFESYMQQRTIPLHSERVSERVSKAHSLPSSHFFAGIFGPQALFSFRSLLEIYRLPAELSLSPSSHLHTPAGKNERYRPNVRARAVGSSRKIKVRH